MNYGGQLKLFGKPLAEQSEMKLLGVTFGCGGSLSAHCKEKAGNATRRLNLMRCLSSRSWGASRRTLLNFYKQYVRPVLETGSVCTAEAGTSSVDMLQRVQNSALRNAFRVGRRTRLTALHGLGRIDPIAVRLKGLRKRALVRFGQSALIRDLELQKMLLLRRVASSDASLCEQLKEHHQTTDGGLQPREAELLANPEHVLEAEGSIASILVQ